MIVQAYEMGLMPEHVIKITLGELLIMREGYNRRQEREWDRTRHLMAFIANYAGFGTKKPITADKILKLDMDRENEIKPISTIEEARELVNSFYDG